MSLPHHVFIEYLASRYPSEAQAVNALTALDLPPPYKGSYLKIRERVLKGAPPDVRRFLNGGALLSLDPLWNWVSGKRFGQCWTREAVFSERVEESYNEAWQILNESATRNVLDCLLVRRADLKDVNDVMSIRFGKNISDRAFSSYKKHFFNLDWTAKDEWLHYLRSCGTTRREMLLLAMRTEDQSRLRHRLGAPPRFEYAEILSDIVATSYFKFKDHAEDPTPAMARAWADIMMKAGDRREKFGARDTSDLKRDLQIEFDYLEMDFPTLHELEGGDEPSE